MNEIVKFIQKVLNQANINVGPVDGLVGPKTASGIAELLSSSRPTAVHWSGERQVVAALQIIINLEEVGEKLTVDGYYGPATEFAFEETLHYLKTGHRPRKWRKKADEISFTDTPNPHGFPNGDEESMKEYYGEPGDPSTHMLIDLPYPVRIAWNTDRFTQKMTVNKKLGEVIYQCLDEVLDAYGRDHLSDLGLDLFGGCYNLRKKRGGSTLSTHAFAAAMDWDPSRNKLRWTDKQANFAKPAYDKWWQIWEKEGFVSLGREKNYDWMHIQATA